MISSSYKQISKYTGIHIGLILTLLFEENENFMGYVMEPES